MILLLPKIRFIHPMVPGGEKIYSMISSALKITLIFKKIFDG
jgi:hypothetical protein